MTLSGGRRWKGNVEDLVGIEYWQMQVWRHMDEYRLTRRQRQIAWAVLSGKSNKEIAAQYSISPNTVKTHMDTLLVKTNSLDRLQMSLVLLGIIQNRENV